MGVFLLVSAAFVDLSSPRRSRFLPDPQQPQPAPRVPTPVQFTIHLQIHHCSLKFPPLPWALFSFSLKWFFSPFFPALPEECFFRFASFPMSLSPKDCSITAEGTFTGVRASILARTSNPPSFLRWLVVKSHSCRVVRFSFRGIFRPGALGLENFSPRRNTKHFPSPMRYNPKIHSRFSYTQEWAVVTFSSPLGLTLSSVKGDFREFVSVLKRFHFPPSQPLFTDRLFLSPAC